MNQLIKLEQIDLRNIVRLARSEPVDFGAMLLSDEALPPHVANDLAGLVKPLLHHRAGPGQSAIYTSGRRQISTPGIVMVFCAAGGTRP